jgi:hypothetical protein
MSTTLRWNGVASALHSVEVGGRGAAPECTEKHDR